MSALLLSSPFPVFTDKDGTPLEDGYIYIGTQNLNPETNPITVYFDSGLTIPAAQPIRTIGGYPSRNGVPAQLYVISSCSITVRDKRGGFVFNSSLFTGVTSAQSVVDNIASLRQMSGIENQSVLTLSYYSQSDGGNNSFFWSSTSTATDNGGTVIKPTAVSGAGRWLAVNTSFVNAKQFGVVANGSTDDSNILQLALNTGATVWIPPVLNVALASPVTMSTANQNLIIDGTLTSTVATNKVIVANASGIKITGRGNINSPAIFDGTNAATTYAIIWVTANFFTLKGLTFNNVPRVCVRLEDATNANISDCTAFGNFPLASFDAVGATTTVHNFVSINPPASGSTNDSVIITNNTMYQFISAISSGDIGAASKKLSIQISNNRFTNCLDHGMYLRNSNGAIVSNNNFYNCYSPIVIDGIGSVATGNTLYEDGTFANRRTQILNIRSGKNCIVTGNTIYGKGAAIDCSYVTDNPDILNNIIAGNTVIQTEADDVRTPFCIRLSSTAGQVTGNKVTNNIVKTLGSNALSGAIVINGNATYSTTQNTVTDNDITVNGSILGVTEVLGDDNNIHRNRIYFQYNAASATTLAGLYIAGGSTSAVGNKIYYKTGGTNVTIRGIQIAGGNTGEFYNNKFKLTSASLTATAEYFNSASTTNFVSSKKRIERSVAPVSGTWVVGDVVYNSAPTAGGFIGWVCTTAGSPGTWKTWGAITA